MDLDETTVSQVSPTGVNSWKYHYCMLCGFKTVRRNHLAAHIRKGCLLQNEQPYACSSCSYRASTRADLKRHLKFHLLKTPHPCELCSYSAISVSHLTRHLNRDHGAGRSASSKGSLKYRCKHCPFRCRKSAHFRNHNERHEIKSAFQCEVCSYSSASIRRVSFHYNRYHRKEPSTRLAMPAKVKVEQPERLRTYHCGLCGYLSYASAGLAKHELAHRVRSAHQCRLCSFSSKSASRLERHVLQDHPRKKSGGSRTIPPHSGERPFPCSQCDYRASRAAELKKHLLKHRMREAHQCQLCSYSSNKATHVTLHRIRHHKPGPGRFNPQPDKEGSKRSTRKEAGMTYGCNRCGFRTSLLSNLRFHMWNHLKKTNDQCTLCSYSAGSKWRLGVHLKRDHENESSAHHQDPGINFKEADKILAEMKLDAHLKRDHRNESAQQQDPEINFKEADKILAEVKRHPVDGNRTRMNKKRKKTSGFHHRPYETCSSCDYKTNHRHDMMKHRQKHSWNERFRCPRCSYSSMVQQGIDKHIRLHHKDGPKEKDGSVRQRAEVMKGKVRLLQDDVDRLSAKRKEIQRWKKEALVWKAGTEAAVLALKSEVDRLRQLTGKESPDLTEEATTRDLLDAERKVQLSMADLQERANEVEGVEKEEEKVEEELTSAQESLLGAEQVLSILEREVELI